MIFGKVKISKKQYEKSLEDFAEAEVAKFAKKMEGALKERDELIVDDCIEKVSALIKKRYPDTPALFYKELEKVGREVKQSSDKYQIDVSGEEFEVEVDDYEK